MSISVRVKQNDDFVDFDIPTEWKDMTLKYWTGLAEIINTNRKKTELRKPGNLMIKQMQNKWHINLNKSFMIGDKITDKMCAEKSSLYFEYSKKDFLDQVKKIIKKI